MKIFVPSPDISVIESISFSHLLAIRDLTTLYLVTKIEIFCSIQRSRSIHSKYLLKTVDICINPNSIQPTFMSSCPDHLKIWILNDFYKFIDSYRYYFHLDIITELLSNIALTQPYFREVIWNILGNIVKSNFKKMDVTIRLLLDSKISPITSFSLDQLLEVVGKQSTEQPNNYFDTDDIISANCLNKNNLNLSLLKYFKEIFFKDQALGISLASYLTKFSYDIWIFRNIIFYNLSFGQISIELVNFERSNYSFYDLYLWVQNYCKKEDNIEFLDHYCHYLTSLIERIDLNKIQNVDAFLSEFFIISLTYRELVLEKNSTPKFCISSGKLVEDILKFLRLIDKGSYKFVIELFMSFGFYEGIIHIFSLMNSYGDVRSLIRLNVKELVNTLIYHYLNKLVQSSDQENKEEWNSKSILALLIRFFFFFELSDYGEDFYFQEIEILNQNLLNRKNNYDSFPLSSLLSESCLKLGQLLQAMQIKIMLNVNFMGGESEKLLSESYFNTLFDVIINAICLKNGLSVIMFMPEILKNVNIRDYLYRYIIL